MTCAPREFRLPYDVAQFQVDIDPGTNAYRVQRDPHGAYQYAGVNEPAGFQDGGMPWDEVTEVLADQTAVGVDMEWLKEEFGGKRPVGLLQLAFAERVERPLVALLRCHLVPALDAAGMERQAGDLRVLFDTFRDPAVKKFIFDGSQDGKAFARAFGFWIDAEQNGLTPVDVRPHVPLTAHEAKARAENRAKIQEMERKWADGKSSVKVVKQWVRPAVGLKRACQELNIPHKENQPPAHIQKEVASRKAVDEKELAERQSSLKANRSATFVMVNYSHLVWEKDRSTLPESALLYAADDAYTTLRCGQEVERLDSENQAASTSARSSSEQETDNRQMCTIM